MENCISTLRGILLDILHPESRQVICGAVFVIFDGLRDFHKSDEYQDFIIAATMLTYFMRTSLKKLAP